jgi:hypothetical protein
MSVPAALVDIQRPCPVELPEDFRGGARNRHCAHCDKTVHLLSSLTEGEAKAFLERSAGRDVCVTYLVDDRGDILFRPEAPVVPISALRRRVGAAAAVGLGLALAACAPHDNPRVKAQVVQAAGDEPCESKPPIVPTIELPERRMLAGGIGRVAPKPIATPKVEAKVERPPRMVRGGRG